MQRTTAAARRTDKRVYQLALASALHKYASHVEQMPYYVTYNMDFLAPAMRNLWYGKYSRMTWQNFQACSAMVDKHGTCGLVSCAPLCRTGRIKKNVLYLVSWM